MKNDFFLKNGFVYSKWYFLILSIGVIAFAISLVFSTVLHINLLILFLQSCLMTTVMWGGCYAIVQYIWKKYPWENVPRKHLFLEITLISILLIVVYSALLQSVAMQHSISFSSVVESNIYQIIITTLITFLITTIHEAVFFYQQWKHHFSKSISLEKDNIEARYNALKSQVNPHFLFNSLNSLMNLLENNPKAEQYVQDLSEYLRYVLLSNSHKTVEVQEELDYLQKYIHLQSLRFENNLQMEINIKNEWLNYHLPPLTLQMLVENCIKHNVISTLRPLSIKIYNTENLLTVSNNLQIKATEQSTGQGLKNIEGRYRFLSNEAIKIESDNTHFSVTIPLIEPV